MPEYVIDLSTVNSWQDFVNAFNRDFIFPMGNAQWNGNLDAFNDFLWWPDEHPYRITLRGWSACYAAVNQYRAADGRAILEVICMIFDDNPQVVVVRE